MTQETRTIEQRLDHMARFLMGASPYACKQLLLDARGQIETLRARLQNRVNLCACRYGSTSPSRCLTCKADEESLR